MKRQVSYQCEHCKKRFKDKRLCQTHELDCGKKREAADMYKARLTSILKLLENKGYNISFRYESGWEAPLIVIYHKEQV